MICVCIRVSRPWPTGDYIVAQPPAPPKRAPDLRSAELVGLASGSLVAEGTARGAFPRPLQRTCRSRHGRDTLARYASHRPAIRPRIGLVNGDATGSQ